MPDVLHDSPPPPDVNKSPPGVAEWLGGLLDVARDRDDAPLARLIAGVMDDLGRAAKG